MAGRIEEEFMALTMESTNSVGDVVLQRALRSAILSLSNGHAYRATVSLGAISELTDQELLAFRNMGPKGVEAIRNFVNQNLQKSSESL